MRALFPGDRHKKRNTTIHFRNGMTLWVLGAHNKTNLQRRSIRWLIGDETWRWPTGHMAEAEARVTAFGWLGKCLFMSQGGEENDDTHRKFETTDMREWTFQCPKCGTRQPWSWEQIEWSKSARDDQGEWDYAEVRRTAAMRCASCNHYFDDSDRTRRELNATGRFIPQNPRAAKESVGFHWNSVSTMSWGALAELYLRAKAIARRGDISALKQFYQKRLALPWREYEEDYKLEITRGGYRKGELWEDEAGVNARGQLVAAPFEPGDIAAPLRILTVDCQMDHVFAVVRSWSANGSSRLIWNERLLTFDDVEALQARFGIHPSLVFLDAGYATYDVYRECGKRGWVALMGDRRPTFVHRTKTGQVRAAVLLAETQGGPRARQPLLRPLLEQSEPEGHARPAAAQSGPGAGRDLGGARRHRRRVSRADGKRTPGEERRQMDLGAMPHFQGGVLVVHVVRVVACRQKQLWQGNARK